LSYFIIGARGNYHFVVNEKVDPYIGAILAFNIFDSKWKGTYADPSYNFSAAAIIPGFYVEGRYLFTGVKIDLIITDYTHLGLNGYRQQVILADDNLVNRFIDNV
jgi:hypothetical protein